MVRRNAFPRGFLVAPGTARLKKKHGVHRSSDCARSRRRMSECYDETKKTKRTCAMITVANRIYVAPEYAEAFEQRFRERAGLVDQMPGFMSNQVLRPVNEGDPYVVFTIWNSR